MPLNPENMIKLRDGRGIGYAEYGDPNGVPVLHFHGFPSSRFEGCRNEYDEITSRLKIRVIVIERPGYGLSDFKKGRTIVDWPDDVIEFADSLHLDRFSVIGMSGGGPYSAACAWKIPQRIIKAGIVSGVSPLHFKGAFEGMNKSDRLAYKLALRAPWLLRLVYWWVGRDLKRNPAKFFSQYVKEFPVPDQLVFEQSDISEMFYKMGSEAFRTGPLGVTWDTILLTHPWGFSLKDITIPVYLWQGEMDNMVPPAQGRYLTENIPDCHSTFYKDEGHISLLTNHYEEIFRIITNSPTK
jgi:pimeloyl-ACP methyl ester carboxylesterase